MRSFLSFFLVSAVFSFSFFIGTTNVFAATCASQIGSNTPSGNNWLSSYGDYGIPFTVSADCDVTNIKIETGNDGTNGTYVGIIWNSSDTVLVTGSSVSVNDATCSTLRDSTVSSGTYTLLAGIQYWVRYSDTRGSIHLKDCGYTIGITKLQYYSSGWTDWVPYPNFEIDGINPPPAAASSSAPYLSSFLDEYNTLIWIMGGCFLLLALFKVLFDIGKGGSTLIGKYE